MLIFTIIFERMRVHYHLPVYNVRMVEEMSAAPEFREQHKQEKGTDISQQSLHLDFKIGKIKDKFCKTLLSGKSSGQGWGREFESRFPLHKEITFG